MLQKPTIDVEKGNEFRIKVRNINEAEKNNIFETDIFGEAYKQAAMRVEEIVTASDKNGDDDSADGNYLNNIIAFSGERGQGKSSAMLSFANYLKNISKFKEDSIFGTNTRAYNFNILETIDPSTFEDMHNILEVVIARMYNNFIQKYKKNNTFVSKEKKNEITGLFSKTYEILCFIRNPRKLEELEYDYEGNIQKITQTGDSTNLQKTLKDLIKAYLDIMAGEKGKQFLVIPIDDLDINIKYAYKIAEQIRKYLILPNVLIIMAINIEQLKKCIEMEFRKQFAALINKQYPLPDDETINMAAKYVEKLIPDGRKISLPEIRTISQSGNDAVVIKYHEKGSEENILDRGDREGIEETLLGYIYDKTEIVFIKPQNGVHSIIPNTLREVVNLLSVLGKMDDLGKLVNKDDKKKAQLENILLFEDYFLHTWIPNNLDYGNIKIIKDMLSVSDFEKHRLLCVKIMDIIEAKEGMYTVDSKDNISQLYNSIQGLKEKLSKKNTNYMSYSLGDVFDFLHVLSTRYINTQTTNLVFAIKTLYTITMHKIVLKESCNNGLSPNAIYKFVGGDIWGIRVMDTMRANRARFEFDTHKYLGPALPDKKYYSPKNPIEGSDAIKIFIMAFWSNFPDIDWTYDQVLYQNNFIADNFYPRQNAEFSISNIFVSFLDIEYLKIKSGLELIRFDCEKYIEKIRNGVNIDLIQKIVINMELNEFVLQYSTQKVDIKNSAVSSSYFENLVYRIENSLGVNTYIQLGELKTRPTSENLFCTIFNDKTFEYDLKEGFAAIQNTKFSTFKLQSGTSEENENQNEEEAKQTANVSNISEVDNINTIIGLYGEYYREVDEILSSRESKPHKIVHDMGDAKLNRILSQTKELAYNLAYIKNYKEFTFREDIIQHVRSIYADCRFAETINDYKERLSLIKDLRKHYMTAAKDIQSLLDSLPPEE